jgi:Cdc6-like AAA superfamily ATPase
MMTEAMQLWDQFLEGLNATIVDPYIHPYSKFCSSTDQNTTVEDLISVLLSLSENNHSVSDNRALLGPIGVGKSMIMKLLALFSLSCLPKLRPVYISYDNSGRDLQLPSNCFKLVWGYPTGVDTEVSLVKYFEAWKSQKVFPIFFLDEFQNVYEQNNFHLLLDEIVELMQYGMLCIVDLSHVPKGLVIITGSSSFLPDKLYSPPVNLNNGKLRRRCLSCIHTLDLFREFIHLLGYSRVSLGLH